MIDQAPRPNVIVIFADDLGYGDLGCYGSPTNETPRLDQMAAEGVRFTDFYAAAPVCTPSRAALMTGCHPHRVGLSAPGRGALHPGSSAGLHPDERTVADVLKEAGYATRLIGKWHLGDQAPFLPTRHGFDGYFGLPFSNDMQPAHPQNARHQFPPLPLMRDEAVTEVDPNQVTLTDRYVEDALGFIRNHAAAQQPFFLCLSHMYVHLPLHVPYRFIGREHDNLYKAAVEHMDATTGVLLDTLRELGIDEQTLVVFTSDNGSNLFNGGSNAPLRGGKGSLWEGGFRMPCLMRHPGRIQAGTTCSAMATMMDLLPTFAGLAGVQPPTDRALDGFDLAACLDDPQGAESPHEAFPYYDGQGRLGAVRSGRWKHFVEESGALYDLEADPGETRDVSDRHREVTERLQALAARYRDELGDAKFGLEGTGCRPVGQVEAPRALTDASIYDPAIRALYDLDGADDG